MHFFLGLVMLFVGLWLLQRAASVIARRESAVVRHLRLIELKYKLAEKRAQIVDAETTRLRLRLKSQELRALRLQPDELTRLVTEDAIKREQRAKAALAAVLRCNGCDEDQIEAVLSRVDGEHDEQ